MPKTPRHESVVLIFCILLVLEAEPHCSPGEPRTHSVARVGLNFLDSSYLSLHVRMRSRHHHVNHIPFSFPFFLIVRSQHHKEKLCCGQTHTVGSALPCGLVGEHVRGPQVGPPVLRTHPKSSEMPPKETPPAASALPEAGGRAQAP